MQCYIYKSLKKSELYLYLDNKDDFSKVPETLLKSFGKLEFVMEIDITEKRQLAKEDPKKVLAQLEETGFFVQLPPTIIFPELAKENSKMH